MPVSAPNEQGLVSRGRPGRGPDLPSDLSQGEKRQASAQDLPSKHSPSSSSLGAPPASCAPSARVHCPAQPVGYVCLPLRQAPGQTCPLGHSMEPALIRSARVLRPTR